MVNYQPGKDDLRRAQLLLAVQGERRRLVHALEELVQAIDRESASPLPPSRLNGLATSLAWHQRRPGSAERLRAFANELTRLEQRATEGSAEWRLYRGLRELLNLEQPASTHELRLLRSLQLETGEQQRWWLELRLLLAQAAVQMVGLLAGTRPLRAAIERNGGSIQWP